MSIRNVINSYQQRFPNFDKTPKTVIASIAFSFALQICEDDFERAAQLIRDEWGILNVNGIVRQRALKR